MTTDKLVDFTKEEGEELRQELQVVLDKYNATFQIVPRQELQLLKIVKDDTKPTTEEVAEETKAE